MTKSDLIWIKTMEWCSKYWGCHQMPERSFFIFGYQFPVCARCTGIILGEITSIIFAPFFQPRLSMCLPLMIPMLIDGIAQYKTKYISTNPRRFLSGLLFGYSFISLLIIIVQLLVAAI